MTGDKERINLGLPPQLTKRMNTYCMKRTQKEERIDPRLKTKITYAALTEWFDNHEKDFDIPLEPEETEET